jgi:hypothetical protein
VTEPRPRMTSDDATTLYALRCVWEGKYKIDRDDDGTWRASRLINGVSLLSATTGTELRTLLAEDYSNLIRAEQRAKR